MYVCQLYPAIIKIQLKAKKFNQGFFFTILFMPEGICNLTSKYLYSSQSYFFQILNWIARDPTNMTSYNKKNIQHTLLYMF